MSDVWYFRRERAATIALYAAVAFMPFSVTLCHIALITFLILWLFEKKLVANIHGIRRNYQLLALMAFAVVLLFGISYSESKQTAWFAIEKKAFFFVLPFAFASSALISQNLLKNLLIIFCWSCFVALIICYVEAYQSLQLFRDGQLGTESINYLSSSNLWTTQEGTKEWMFFSYVGLSRGVNMHPTYLSMYAAFCCVVLIHQLLQGNMKPLHQAANVLLIAFFSCSIIFLSTRIILILIGLIYLGLFGYQIFRAKRKLIPALTFFVSITILIAGILVNPVTRYRQVDEIALNGFSVSPNKNYNNSTGIRASLWWLSVQTYINSNLLIGVGTGDVEDAVKATGAKFGITNVLNSYNPHNEYLNILLSTGILGLVFFLIYVGAGLAKAWQNHDIIFLNFMVLFLAVCITESALELQKGIVFFSIFFSCMSFQKTDTEKVKDSLNVARVATQIR